MAAKKTAEVEVKGQAAENERFRKVVVYLIGTCDKLKGMGVLEGGKYQLAERGKAEYMALIASGFKPTDDEIDFVMSVLQSQATAPK